MFHHLRGFLSGSFKNGFLFSQNLVILFKVIICEDQSDFEIQRELLGCLNFDHDFLIYAQLDVINFLVVLSIFARMFLCQGNIGLQSADNADLIFGKVCIVESEVFFESQIDMLIDLLNVKTYLLRPYFKDKSFGHPWSSLLLQHEAMEQFYAFFASLTGIVRFF